MMKEMITKEGLEALMQKLDYLKKVRRIEIAESLKYATELGDLPENAEYDAALMEYDEIEYQIAKLEYILNNHIIMESKTYKVKFDDGEIEEFKLVGQNEVDVFENKISPSSMMGMELMNSKIGDYKQYEINGYISKFEVLDIV